MNEPAAQNEHLRPIFEIVIPALESAGVPYWVFGGVGLAGHAGGFYRENGDVDVYVREVDFPRVEPLLTQARHRFSTQSLPWRLKKPDLLRGRPKLDLKIGSKIRFSVIVSTVLALLQHRGPSAIRRLVVSVVIDSINGMLRSRPRTHVF